MEKITINTEKLLKETDEAIIKINGIQELLNEIKEIISDKYLKNNDMKYKAVIGAAEIFKIKYKYN